MKVIVLNNWHKIMPDCMEQIFQDSSLSKRCSQELIKEFLNRPETEILAREDFNEKLLDYRYFAEHRDHALCIIENEAGRKTMSGFAYSSEKNATVTFKIIDIDMDGTSDEPMAEAMVQDVLDEIKAYYHGSTM